MKYPTYKRGQRVFVFFNGVLFKGQISKAKNYKSGTSYLVVGMRRYDACAVVTFTQQYVHPTCIASFNDKRKFGNLVRKYQEHLLKHIRAVNKNISHYHKMKTRMEKDYDKAESLLWK